MEKRYSAQICQELMNLTTWYGVETSLPTTKMAEYPQEQYRSNYAWKLTEPNCKID